MHFSTDRAAHTTAFDGPVVDHWLKPKIAQTHKAPATLAATCPAHAGYVTWPNGHNNKGGIRAFIYA